MCVELQSDTPQDVKDAMKDARNVTGAEFVPPMDLDGYLDEPRMTFGLWVGPDEDNAELMTFELNGDQIDDFAGAFELAADDAEELGGA